MTFWLKTKNGSALKLRDKDWHARIYASGSACDDVAYLLSRAQASWLVRATRTVYKIDNVYKREKHPVLEIELKEDRARKLAELLENAFSNPATFSLYNVDVLPEQQYFYDKKLFPLAFVKVETDGDDRQVTGWELLDSVNFTDYDTPALRCLRLDAKISDRVPTFQSKLEGIALSPLDHYGSEENEVIIEGTEADILSETISQIERLDPDILVTRNGDSFVLPFLYSKASKYSINLKLNRDKAAGDYVRNTSEAKTYFSYGKIMYRPATQRLFGRLHLDEENTFIYDQCRLQGLFEVSRLCRMPFHTSMRASIGKCLSSLQFYYASKKDILIPWKPKIAEDFKSGYNLLLADRGGLVLEPLPGAFDHVGELDFASLYPSIIRKFNISVETVNCNCCRDLPSENPQKNDDSKNSFEGLDIHVCGKENGIVADSLGPPLDKRVEYKRLRDTTDNKRLKQIYNERAGSLKWILVCCLPKDAPVLVKVGEERSKESVKKIGELIDGLVGKQTGIIDCPQDIFVAGLSRILDVKFCKVDKLVKIPRKHNLLCFTLNDGRQIVTTADHPSFVQRKEYEWEVIPAISIKIGDEMPVASAKSFEELPVCDFRLTHVRVKKIEELDRKDDEFVYCFQLVRKEIPGFFAGEGLIFTHNCFGYLSYRNAKFGKIDSHIAVCAKARETLLDAMHIAEYRGFEVAHGIVDSFWLLKKKAKLENYMELCEEIEEETGFRISVEGIYKWIVFLPSKIYPQNQVANRYFGCFEESNDIKTRGIEVRRHDTPSFFRECQSEILHEFAQCNSVFEVAEAAKTKGIAIFSKYAQRLERHDVPALDLVIRRRLSKELNEYSSKRQLSVSAASKLERDGLKLRAGQSVSYVITQYKSSGPNRAVPEELIHAEEYDSERYIQLLGDCCATVLSPFGVTKEMLLSRSQPLMV